MRSVRSRRLSRLAAVVVAFATLNRPVSAQVIDTRNGTPLTTTGVFFGQTFTAPIGATQLDRFAFWLAPFGDGGGGDPSFRTHILVWNGTQPVGPSLFTSAPRELAACCALPTEASFLTPGLAVTGGMHYLALVESLQGGFAYARPGADELFADSYAGGGGVIAGCPSGVLDGDCFWVSEAEDVAFVAEFSSPATVVPEPASAALVALGLAGCVIGRRRRRA